MTDIDHIIAGSLAKCHLYFELSYTYCCHNQPRSHEPLQLGSHSPALQIHTQCGCTVVRLLSLEGTSLFPAGTTPSL